MFEIKMKPELEALLHELADEAGVSAHDFALNAIKNAMEDFEDTRDAMASEAEGGRTYSLEEVMRKLELEDRISEKSPETAA